MITDPKIGFAGNTIKAIECLEKSVFILELLHLFLLFFGNMERGIFNMCPFNDK